MLKCFPRQQHGFDAPSTAGLTLVETMVALLVFLATLAGVVPVYMSYRLQTLKNPVRTGAVAVSQKIMDELRQSEIDTLPSSGVEQTISPTGATLTNIDAYDKKFNAKIYFCEKPEANLCDAKSRHIRVAVFQAFSNGTVGNQPVYEVSSIFTKFDLK
ncbi:PilW family protein [Altericista sp. CCNU0014]|uniref:PilW family protein n=1 Tax=Altericista sp. CCNU0014 TaxID=3082949 RepID=UPI00384FDE67